MKMRLQLTWEKCRKEYDPIMDKYIVSKDDEDKIFLDVCVIGLGEKESYAFMDDLETMVNEKLASTYGKTSFFRCSGYEDVRSDALYDTLSWDRDFGNITDQKCEIVTTIKEIAKVLRKRYENKESNDGKM